MLSITVMYDEATEIFSNLWKARSLKNYNITSTKFRIVTYETLLSKESQYVGLSMNIYIVWLEEI